MLSMCGNFLYLPTQREKRLAVWRLRQVPCSEIWKTGDMGAVLRTRTHRQCVLECAGMSLSVVLWVASNYEAWLCVLSVQMAASIRW